MSEAYDKLRDEALAMISRSGQCFTNEARAMARELIELRAQHNKIDEPLVYYDPVKGFTTIP